MSLTHYTGSIRCMYASWQGYNCALPTKPPLSKSCEHFTLALISELMISVFVSPTLICLWFQHSLLQYMSDEDEETDRELS